MKYNIFEVHNYLKQIDSLEKIDENFLENFSHLSKGCKNKIDNMMHIVALSLFIRKLRQIEGAEWIVYEYEKYKETCENLKKAFIFADKRRYEDEIQSGARI